MTVQRLELLSFVISGHATLTTSSANLKIYHDYLYRVQLIVQLIFSIIILVPLKVAQQRYYTGKINEHLSCFKRVKS